MFWLAVSGGSTIPLHAILLFIIKTRNRKTDILAHHKPFNKKFSFEILFMSKTLSTYIAS
ncbi:hypothetical protein OIU79_018819 [Salix purpurea]|uniref:Uncharacterized protein n=1 Tax=Salix purpurea TaxID=77065 RepID=A0A9Q0NZQ1_SALPP|nr:hypothetical protein OIU79_018819 [Salix purpurea]